MRKINNAVRATVFAVLVTSSPLAFCEPNPIQEIEKLNRDISVLAKKREFLEIQQRYQDALKRSDTIEDHDIDAPKVTAIEGVSGRFIATVEQGGKTLTRGVGEAIPGGWKVGAISEKDVIFVKGKKNVRVPISFGNEVPSMTSATPPLPSSMPPLPFPSQNNVKAGGR